MAQNWKLWCRLCAHEDPSNVNMNTLPPELNFPTAIHNLFSINISEDTELGKMICLNCQETVERFIEFGHKVSRVQTMFMEIINSNKQLDVEDLKTQYKLEEEYDQKSIDINPMETFYEPEISLMPNPSDEMVDFLETTDIKLEMPNEDFLERSEAVYVPNKQSCNNDDEDVESKSEIGQTMDEPTRPDTPNSITLDITCSDCKKTFASLYNLKRHLKKQHGAAQKVFICENCGKICKTIQKLDEHKLVHIEGRPFKCKQCDKSFKNKLRLKYHEDTHSTTSYICTICGIRLNSKPTLNMHMVVHSDQKRFKCNYCGNEYKRAKALKTHLILHSGLKPYSCDFCDRTFANGSNCRSHKKKSHPIELAAMEAAGKTTNHTKVPELKDLQTSLTIEDIPKNGSYSFD